MVEERARTERRDRAEDRARLNAERPSNFRGGVVESATSQSENQGSNWNRLSIQDAFQTLAMFDPLLPGHRVESPHSSSQPSSTEENGSQRSAFTTSDINSHEAGRAGAQTSNNTNNDGTASTTTTSSSRPVHHPVWQHVQLSGIASENWTNLIGNENIASLPGSQNGPLHGRRAVRIPPLTVHASRAVRSPALDHRVPSPAPSLSSNNSSSRSDPLARAGGIPVTDDPLMPEVSVQSVNNLNNQRLNQLNRNARSGGPSQPGAIGMPMPCRVG